MSTAAHQVRRRGGVCEGGRVVGSVRGFEGTDTIIIRTLYKATVTKFIVSCLPPTC